jgi:DNA-binding CsgD family transcriptional regulator
VALLLGDWDRAEAQWTRIEENAARRENWSQSGVAALGLASVRGLRDDPTAVDLLREVFFRALSAPGAVLQMRSGPELAMRLAESGRLEEAESVLQTCREIVAGGEDWRGLTGRFELAESVVAYGGSRFNDADARFEKALAIFQRYSLSWDEADAHHRRGRLLARRGRRYRAAAATAFDAAMDIYRRLGAAEPWTAGLLASRKRLLGRVEPEGPLYPDGLSGREVDVLRLIAAGKSNREIADEIVLSVRTVERHITNIYAKIGARGKADATVYALRHSLT